MRITNTLILAACLFTVHACKPRQKTADPSQTNTMTNPITYPAPYDQFADGLYAEFNTGKGVIICLLEHEKSPLTVANFVGLAEGKIANTAKPAGVPFYDSLTFHRCIADFMIQGGDPKGNGSGGPGYRFIDEFHPGLRHGSAGILSMANSGPATNGSQFFITHVATPWLDFKHSIFGRVVQGQEVVNAITDGTMINSVRIIRKGEALQSYDPTKIDVNLFLRRN
jgi:peptidyl-prolyl cis-trans isomerase A (cyclophilin A)